MYIEKPNELFRPCVILPLDEHEGLIVCIRYDKCGAEALVRYFMYGSVLHNWFYDFELELKQPKNKDKTFFKG